MEWKWDRRGKRAFTVRSYFGILRGAGDHNFPWKGIWIGQVPRKFSFLLWTAVWDKNLTLDNLQKRGFHLPNQCVLCTCSEESVNHLFLHCPLAFDLWQFVFSVFGFHWVMPKCMKDVIYSWSGWCGTQGRGKIWNIIPHFLLWRIWGEQNTRTFEGDEMSIVRVKSAFLYDLFEWLRDSS